MSACFHCAAIDETAHESWCPTTLAIQGKFTTAIIGPDVQINSQGIQMTNSPTPSLWPPGFVPPWYTNLGMASVVINGMLNSFQLDSCSLCGAMVPVTAQPQHTQFHVETFMLAETLAILRTGVVDYLRNEPTTPK